MGGDLAMKYGISAMPTLKVVSRDGSTIFEKVGGGQGNVNACFDHALDARLIQQSADSVWISSDAKNQEELLDILSKEDGPVVLSFMANWGGPCKAIAPYIAQQSEAKGVHVVTVDVDEAGDLAMKYGISAMPTLKVVSQDGSTIFEKVGGGQGNVNACFDHALEAW